MRTNGARTWGPSIYNEMVDGERQTRRWRENDMHLGFHRRSPRKVGNRPLRNLVNVDAFIAKGMYTPPAMYSYNSSPDVARYT